MLSVRDAFCPFLLKQLAVNVLRQARNLRSKLWQIYFERSSYLTFLQYVMFWYSEENIIFKVFHVTLCNKTAVYNTFKQSLDSCQRSTIFNLFIK